MYQDKRKHRLAWALCAVFLTAAVAFGARALSRNASEEMRLEAERSIQETVRRSALQCFTVEGVYPESLEYLREHYGLRVNTDDYYVVYEIFADNLPPSIRVARKER